MPFEIGPQPVDFPDFLPFDKSRFCVIFITCDVRVLPVGSDFEKVDGLVLYPIPDIEFVSDVFGRPVPGEVIFKDFYGFDGVKCV